MQNTFGARPTSYVLEQGVIPAEREIGVQQKQLLPISREGTQGEQIGNQPITKLELDQAREELRKYKNAKALMDARIVANEEWWKMQHMHYIQKEQKRETDTPSAWLFNAIANKHADAMDNYPSASALPREPSDRDTAEILSSVLPVVMEQCEFEKTYDSAWWYKLKMGLSCYGVFWDSDLQNGLGDVSIRKIDILHLFWQPGITDIQESRNVFYISMVDTDLLEAEYPQLKGKLGTTEEEPVKYQEESTVNKNEKTAVIEWYYRRMNMNGKNVLHYVKFAGDEVLSSTENEPSTRESGLYEHGMYPFVLDPLYPLEGTLDALGIIDVMKGPQTRIDRLQSAITENVQESSIRRYWYRDGAGVNEAEFNDRSRRLVHVTGRLDEENIREMKTDPLDGVSVTMLNNYIDELKETSGNRDVSQGGTTSGVTAASAIAAMMEAGSKLSRDMIKASYRAFSSVCKLVLENIRQFYREERFFRITQPNGGMGFVPFSNAGMLPQQQMMGQEVKMRLPVFDIVVKAQKASAYSRMAQNEWAKELYNLGFFNPQQTDMSLAALKIMDFEGKEEVQRMVEENGTMYQKISQLQAIVLKMTAMVDPTGQQGILNSLAQQGLIDDPAQAGGPIRGGSGGGGQIAMNALGAEMGTNNLVERAKANVQESTAPR